MRIYTIDGYRSGDISGVRRLLSHPPSKELQSLQLVVLPNPDTGDYPSFDLSGLDDALLTAVANSWRNVHFSVAVYATLEKAEDVTRRFKEEGFPLLNAKSPLAIVVVHGACC